MNEKKGPNTYLRFIQSLYIGSRYTIKLHWTGEINRENFITDHWHMILFVVRSKPIILSLPRKSGKDRFRVSSNKGFSHFVKAV